MKDKRNIVIVALLLVMVVMSYGFVSYSINTNEKTNSNIKVWDVAITDVKTVTTGTASVGELDYNGGVLVIDPIIRSNVDTVTYTVTITNNGLLDAKLNRTLYTEKNPKSVIKYMYENGKDILKSKESITIMIKAYVDEDSTIDTNIPTTNELTALYEFVQN